jgi:hypothetical protein
VLDRGCDCAGGDSGWFAALAVTWRKGAHVGEESDQLPALPYRPSHSVMVTVFRYRKEAAWEDDGSAARP